MGLEYLIDMLYIDDTEVFKVCLDYWNNLVTELFEANHSIGGLQLPLLSCLVDGLGLQIVNQRQLYSTPMLKLRMLIISRMAKPKEVLIVEDQNGIIVHETLKDNHVLIQY
ncbi:hypothetical protein GIB67_031391 [Kingdonia uniflora]|uniref:Uncharacterized protein n=1 Tax=Kingdonia uniflora TaxID=39325 RepID=A0A7J7MB36_9MAGN|nr:hypothetical protein GIB67_031391 [Kingdonia uniflora]